MGQTIKTSQIRNGAITVEKININGNLEMNGNRLTELANAVDPTDAVPLAQVELMISEGGGGGGAASPLLGVVVKSVDATLTEEENVVLVNTASGNITITIPHASLYDVDENKSKLVYIKKASSDANTVIVLGDSGNIDGLSTHVISLYRECAIIVSDNTNFFILNL